MFGAVAAGAAVAAVTVAGWFLTRWTGRGRPCPVLLAPFFDNALTDRISGTSMLLDRAGVVAGMRVLDAGCGPGRLTIPLARRVGATGEVVALDIQEGMLERVRRNATKAGVRNVRTLLAPLGADRPELDAQRDSFDRIVLVTVLGEVPDPSGALGSLRAMLKQDGVLSITEMIIDPDYQRRGRVRRMTEGAGLQLDEVFGTPFMFTMNFRRRA